MGSGGFGRRAGEPAVLRPGLHPSIQQKVERAVLGRIETAAPRRARGGVTATHVWTHRAVGMQGPTKEVRNDVLAAIK